MNQHPRPSPSSAPRRRRGVRRVVAVVAIVGAGFVALWVSRAPVAEWALDRWSRAQGFGAFAATIERIDLGGLRAREIRLGGAGGITAQAVEIDYTVAGLIGRRADVVVLRGLRLAANADQDGIAIVGLPRPAKREDGGPLTLAPLPFGQLRIEDGQISLSTPKGPVAALFGGSIAPDGKGGFELQATAKLIATPEATAGALTLKATASATRDGGGRARIGFAGTSLRYGAVTIGDVTGEATVDLAAWRPVGGGLEIALTRLAIAGRPPGNARVVAKYLNGRVSADADIDWPGGRLAVSADGDPRNPAAPVAFSVRGRIDAAAMAALLPGNLTAGGAADIDFSGRLRDPPRALEAVGEEPAKTIEYLSLSGSVALDLSGLGGAGLFSGGAMAGRLRVTAGDGVLHLSAPGGLTFSARRIAPKWLALLPAALREALGPGPVTARLTGAPGTPVAVSLQREADAWRIRAGAVAKLASGGVALSLAADGGLLLDRGLRPVSGEFAFLRAGFGGLRIDGLKTAGDLLLTDLKWAGNGVSATASLTASAGGAIGAVGLRRARLDAGASIDYADGRLRVRPEAGSTLRLDGVTIAGRIALPGPTTLTLDGGHNLLALDGGGGRPRYRVRLRPATIDAVLLPERRRLRLGWDDLAVTGDGRGLHRLDLAGGTISGADLPVAGEAITARLSVTPAGEATAEITVDRLRHAADPPLVTALRARLSGRLAGHRASFAAEITMPGRPLSLSLEGSYDLSRNAGAANIALAPLRFVPGALTPADLFPGVAAAIENVSGAVSAAGRVTFDNGELRTDLRIALDDLGFTAGQVAIGGIGGEIRLDGLMPPTTPPGQKLRATVTAGRLPPVPVTLDYRLRADGSLMIETARAAFAGGKLAADRIAVDLAKKTVRGTISVDDVDLAELVGLLNVETLAATGRLGGEMAFDLADDRPARISGKLVAAGPGTLRLSGGPVTERLSGRGDSVALLVQALADFRYRTLEIGIETGSRESGTVALRLLGANPKVLDGYPFAVNVKLETDFERLIDLVMGGMQSTDAFLRSQIEPLVR